MHLYFFAEEFESPSGSVQGSTESFELVADEPVADSGTKRTGEGKGKSCDINLLPVFRIEHLPNPGPYSIKSEWVLVPGEYNHFLFPSLSCTLSCFDIY